MNELSPHGDAFTELIIEIFRVNRLLLDAGDTLAQPAGLSSARWQVLGVVEHGPIPVAHVARIIGLTRQSVQQTADSLAADGLIVYAENPHHRRAKLVTMTERGRRALGEVQERHAAWANQIAAACPLEGMQTALEVLRQLRGRLDGGAPPVEL